MENSIQNEKQDYKISHTFTLENFKKSVDTLIKTSETSISGIGSRNYLNKIVERTRDYSEKEIHEIISNGSLDKQILLSRNYCNKSGLYKRILIHYATLLMYCGIVVPKFKYGEKLTDATKKRYYDVINYVEDNNLPNLETYIVFRALRDGCYYGLLSDSTDQIVLIDLPPSFCSTTYKNAQGLDLIDFDMRYIDQTPENDRMATLAAYPKFIRKAYDRYKKGKGERVIRIPAELGICLPILDGRPFFLNVIEATIDYEDSVDLAKTRELEEIRKIIVQKIPHLTDGQLLFEPDEAVEIHRGTVEMMKGNPNVSVLTTYADTDALVTRTSADTQSNLVESMVNNVYYEAGASGQLFGSNSNMALETSLKNDLAFCRLFSYKLENIVSNILNDRFGNKTTYRYYILPISHYNSEKYLDSAFKLAQSGYSFLLPTLGLGITPASLPALKKVESEIMNLELTLRPLESAYTQSSGNGEPGAPKKEVEDKKAHTLETEKSLDKQGTNQ